MSTSMNGQIPAIWKTAREVPSILAILAVTLVLGCNSDPNKVPAPKDGGKQEPVTNDGGKQVGSLAKEHVLALGKAVDIDGVRIEVIRANQWSSALGNQWSFTLQFTNSTQTKIINFKESETVGFGTKYYLTVKDEFANDLEIDWRKTGTGKMRLDPGRSFEYSVAFAHPIDACKEITLHANGECIQRPGHAIVCKLPRAEFRGFEVAKKKIDDIPEEEPKIVPIRKDPPPKLKEIKRK